MINVNEYASNFEITLIQSRKVCLISLIKKHKSMEATVVFEFTPSPFEPVTGSRVMMTILLLYRSDFGTTPFNKPTGRFASLPVKSIHGVFDTPLNKDNVWIPFGLQIIIKARKVSLTSVDPADSTPTRRMKEGRGVWVRLSFRLGSKLALPLRRPTRSPWRFLAS